MRAVLDVTDPEPLPDDHPLWSAPGVLSITPHIARDSPAGDARAAALAGEQLGSLARRRRIAQHRQAGLSATPGAGSTAPGDPVMV